MMCVASLASILRRQHKSLSAVLKKKRIQKINHRGSSTSDCVCSHRDTEKRERKREDVFCSKSVLCVPWGSLGRFSCPLWPFPPRCRRCWKRRKEGGIYFQSPARPLICGARCCKPDQRSPRSLFLTRLFRALSTSIRLLRSLPLFPLFLYLFLLVFICSFNAIGSVWTLASSLWPVVRLAAFTAGALISGRGSWLGMTPFGNLLMLRNTGADVVHPCFQVLLHKVTKYKCQLNASYFIPEFVEIIDRLLTVNVRKKNNVRHTIRM